MEVICLQEDAFFALVDRVVTHIKEKEGVTENKWVPSEEAMKILNIKSKTTLQELRDKGKIRFSQTSKKHIMYDRQSLNAYLEEHAQDIF